jgi:hypothetical protein
MHIYRRIITAEIQSSQYNVVDMFYAINHVDERFDLNPNYFENYEFYLVFEWKRRVEDQSTIHRSQNFFLIWSFMNRTKTIHAGLHIIGAQMLSIVLMTNHLFEKPPVGMGELVCRSLQQSFLVACMRHMQVCVKVSCCLIYVTHD